MRKLSILSICRLLLVLTVLVCTVLIGCSSRETDQFSGKRAFKHVQAQCEIGPRPPGSEALRATGDYIIRDLRDLGWEVRTQDFAKEGVDLRNIIAIRGEGPVVLLGAHYDTRPIADREPGDHKPPVMGANDGASGVAVLLELARVLDIEAIEHQIWLVFFDAEDSGDIGEWGWSVGAWHLANSLTIRPAYVIIVDMVGDADQQLYWEWSSTRWLQEKVWGIADELGYGSAFIPRYKHSIIDDHTPFLYYDIPAIDIIDFDYPYWHTRHDTLDKVSSDSLERVGRVLETLLEREPDE